MALVSVPLSWDVGGYCSLDHNVRTVVGWGTELESLPQLDSCGGGTVAWVRLPSLAELYWETL